MSPRCRVLLPSGLAVVLCVASFGCGPSQSQPIEIEHVSAEVARYGKRDAPASELVAELVRDEPTGVGRAVVITCEPATPISDLVSLLEALVSHGVDDIALSLPADAPATPFPIPVSAGRDFAFSFRGNLLSVKHDSLEVVRLAEFDALDLPSDDRMILLCLKHEDKLAEYAAAAEVLERHGRRWCNSLSAAPRSDCIVDERDRREPALTRARRIGG